MYAVVSGGKRILCTRHGSTGTWDGISLERRCGVRCFGNGQRTCHASGVH